MGRRKSEASALAAEAYLTDATAKPEGLRELRAFYYGSTIAPFTFARFYWPPGDGKRESMVERFIRKRQPVRTDGAKDTAARVTLLLPLDAPEVFTDHDLLVRQYEDNLDASAKTAFLQVTMRFPDAVNLHGPHQMATQWLYDYYVHGHGCSVLSVLHAPPLASSETPVHAHGLVLCGRRLSRFGWLEMSANLIGDAAAQDARESWGRHFASSSR